MVFILGLEKTAKQYDNYLRNYNENSVKADHLIYPPFVIRCYYSNTVPRIVDKTADIIAINMVTLNPITP